jgi:hypothetical protein
MKCSPPLFAMRANSPAKRGRPRKFDRPSQFVALTLPDEVVRGLGKINPDLGWAIVTLFEKGSASKAPDRGGIDDVALVRIADRRSLIVVNQAVVKSLPGINIVPLDSERAFLALDPERGMPDLELAVIDRIQDPSSGAHERKALTQLWTLLRTWRRDSGLRFHSRSIIVVERTNRRERSRVPSQRARNVEAKPKK